MIKLNLNEEEKKNLTEEEVELAMARKLEISMLPMLRRNMKFFYAGGNLKGKANAYRTPTSKEMTEQILKTKNGNIEIVCKPLCDMAAEILQENGINAQTVSCDTDMFRHTDVLITTKSGKKYIINYLEDIENIQTGMKTPDFASKGYYERRYKKFENGLTTDGKSLENISFLDEETLDKQLNIAGCNDRRELTFHKMLLNGELPYTIGGGIGQSRICMYFLRKAHIGEVQASTWDDKNLKICEDNGITLL